MSEAKPTTPDPGDGRQWCPGCQRWKFLAIHSCPGVPQPSRVIADLATAIRLTLRAERKARGWTQWDLARALGRVQPTISHWENGERDISAADAEKIAALFEQHPLDVFLPGCSLADLDGWIDLLTRERERIARNMPAPVGGGS